MSNESIITNEEYVEGNVDTTTETATSASPETHESTASKPEPDSGAPSGEPQKDADFSGEKKAGRNFFRFRSNDSGFSRDQWILSRINDEQLMEYLTLEQKRLEFLQKAKEAKEKRILTAFQLTISLAAIVAIIFLLKDNPTILVNILYIIGIIAAFWIWKNPYGK